MKVLLISTSDKIGGAAIACTRIFNALRRNGADVKMLVRDKVSDDPDISTVNTSCVRRLLNFAGFCMERLRILFHLRLSRKNLFQVSIDNIGTYGLLNNPLVKEADVINIHWTSQGMMSVRQLQKLLDAGKRIIVTMHDMHSFTGICHYARNCDSYKINCGNCPYVSAGCKANDISRRWLNRKMDMPGRDRISYVACSRWLADIARTSAMLKDARVRDIPNPINTDVFRAVDREEARRRFGITRKYVVLFGSVNVADERKGFKYLEQAMYCIHNIHPELKNQIELLVFGQADHSVLEGLPYHCTMAGYLKSEADLVAAYSAADTYVIPSLEDNLPNTVMEAMSCSVPCVSFNIGGLPQLIDHKQNGYVANYMDPVDLADGIMYIITHPGYSGLSRSARRKVEECFSEPVVAIKYRNAFRAVGD